MGFQSNVTHLDGRLIVFSKTNVTRHGDAFIIGGEGLPKFGGNGTRGTPSPPPPLPSPRPLLPHAHTQATPGATPSCHGLYRFRATSGCSSSGCR